MSRIIVLIVIITPAIFSDISADENSWSTNGPEGGRIYTIAIHPYDNNTVFIGTIGHGIYKSTDGGQIWQHLESDILHDNLRDIEFHPICYDFCGNGGRHVQKLGWGR
jgi:hypothetical protein